jgi:Nuclease-related domain
MHQGCVAGANDGEEGTGGVVADIAKLSMGREAYYTRELAESHEAYLSGHGESPGRWYGTGATSLGLEGEASGRPGGSAQARWRQLRAAEWTAWTRSLPRRVAATLCVSTAGGVLASLLAPRLSLVLGTVAAVVAGWGLWFRPSLDAVAWRQGAAGERRTARLLGPLERHGWAVLHDLAIPHSQANIDHLLIGPGGVFVIDSKQYRGRLQSTQLGSCGMAATPLPPPCGRRPGRPTRPPRSCPTRARPWCHRGGPWRPGSLGQGCHGRGTGGDGSAPSQHALSAPGRAGAGAGRLAG